MIRNSACRLSAHFSLVSLKSANIRVAVAMMIGTKLAHYEITGHLGTGGMGEVYQATDSKLGRSVAIKLLPETFASDADRAARFQREARVLASLNHPNIAAIHGLEADSGRTFLVMELVPGETLAERIQRGPIPVDETLAFAKHIADALEAAHEKGIVHRDLKPANVKITPDGKVKVLDFGLAKATEDSPGQSTLSQSPTLSLAGTQAGMILGTAAYMSPEQAKGLNTDQRSDIFSFGAVFFEMVTGRQAFQGDSVSEVLASILAREPDLSLMPNGLNPKIYDLLRRALEKNPKRRWHAIGDLRVELEAAMAEPLAKPQEAPQGATASPKPLWKRAVPVAAAIVLTAALTSAGMWYFTPSTPKPLTRFPVTLAEGQQFTGRGRMVVAISPDGSQMVYAANSRLYHRAMSELEARPIPGTETWTLPINPVFSPDGRSLAFWAASDQTLKRIALTGGASVTLCPADPVFGMSWGADGIVFGGTKGILRVSVDGGKPEVLVSVENGEIAHGPQVLPGGEAVLYTVSTSASNAWDKAKIFVQPLKPGSARQLLIDGGADARYVSTGHIVYAYGGTLFAVPFDLRRLQVTGGGGQVPVVEGVRRSAGLTTGSAQFSFSDTGSLIYVPGPVSISVGAQITLATLGRQGGLERLKVPLKAYAFPRVSPDGKRVAVSTDDGKDSNVWIYDLDGSTAPRQLTLGGANRYPVWSANERVAFQSDRDGDLAIFWQKADGTGMAERLTKPEQGVAHIPDSWSRDGKALAYTALKGSEAAVWIYSVQNKKASVFEEKAGARIGRAAFSPGGQWLAYQSTETGTNQIFVQPFPSTGSAKYPIARGGHPFWSIDGREILYNPANGQIAFVGISTGPTFSFGEPTIMQLSGLRSRNPVTDPRVWDVMPDGRKIIGTADASADPTSSGTPAGLQIQVVLNWFEDLKQRMSAK